MNEQQVSALVDRVGRTLEPDVGALVARGTARGRTRRRRRAAASALTGVVAVGAVLGVGLGLGLAPGGGPGGAERTTVDSFAASAPSSSAPSSSAPAESPRRQLGSDPDRAGAMLRELVPAGKVTRVRSWAEASQGYEAGSLLLDGALVTAIVERTMLPGCGELPRGWTCDARGAGFLSLASYDEPMAGGGPSGIRASTATFFTADQHSITVTAFNAPAEKHATPVSARPVLSQGQLARMVQDPAWLTQP